MTELEEEIKSVLMCAKVGNDEYRYEFWNEEATRLAKNIAAAIEEKEPDLPITPGEWYAAFNLAKQEIVAVRSRDCVYTICTVNKKRIEWKENKIAIASLPKVLRAALAVVAKWDTGATRPHIQELKSALEEAGVKIP